MVDLLKLLLDSLSRVIPTIKGGRNDRWMAELANRLYLVYTDFVEVVASAETILLEFSTVNNQMPSYVFELKCAQLLEGLVQQADSLERLTLAIKDVDQELSIVNAEARIDLEVLIKEKNSALNMVLNDLRAGNLPLGKFTGSDFSYLRTTISGGKPDWPGLEPNGFPLIQNHFYIRPWEQAWIAGYFKDFVQQNEMAERLARIRATLELLRESLEENFSKRDLLLYVHSKRK